MEHHEDCKACKLRYNTCAYSVEGIADKCPCLQCLTKVVCDKEKCELRSVTYYEAVEWRVIKEHERTS